MRLCGSLKKMKKNTCTRASVLYLVVVARNDTTKQKTKTKNMNIEDLDYVRSVLAEKVASSVADGDLEPPAGARCKTRSGFRAWLKRAEKEEAKK